MLLSLKDDHKQHFTLLISQPTNVLQDFCRLALDFLRKGPTPKLYQTAAQKLDVEPEIIRNAVEGLVNLLVESCRHQLSEIDFRDSVLALGFSEEHQETLELFYKGKKAEICDVLSQLTLDLPHYHDLEWRFEVQLASRALQHQVTPLITMNLTVETKTAYGGDSTTKTAHGGDSSTKTAHGGDSTTKTAYGGDSTTKTAYGGDSTTKTNIVLQTDPTNLVHITQVLEEALHESRNQHSRRIQRSFK